MGTRIRSTARICITERICTTARIRDRALTDRPTREQK